MAGREMEPHPTMGGDELGERAAAAIRGDRAALDPLATELARARLRADVLREEPGTLRVGRYLVLERIGQGGMGVVYAAWDPELDRKVALKVLHRAALGPGDGGRTRLLREAQAMAKLAHPNVVAVFDVGMFDAAPTPPVRMRATTTGDRDEPEPAGRGWMFIAMELVDGLTLAAWLRAKPRSTDAILRVLIDAGRGLAAAHAHGLVHRDFKPDNVMIDRDAPADPGPARVRVMDFGLAAPLEHRAEPDDTADSSSQRAIAELASTWSRANGLAGTPAYMAPEQLVGAEATPAADQFAFCVTLWEAVHGRRPFAGDSLPELCAAVLEGRRAPMPGAAGVPAWLRRVLDRGLARAPEQRWPSMPALIAELERGRGARTRRRRFVVLGAGLAVVAGLGLARELDRRRTLAACDTAAARIDEVWNEARRAAVRAGIGASPASYAAATAERVIPWLDGRAEAWRTERREACLDATVRARLDPELAARADWCLESRKVELDAIASQLAQADTPMLQGAVIAVATMGPLDGCRDPAELAAMSVPPVEQRDAVAELRIDVARTLALRTAGAYEQALAEARLEVARARELGWVPVIASTRVLEASIASRLGKNAEAETILVEAYLDAGRVGAWDVAANAANNLIAVESAMGELDDAIAWGQHARMVGGHAPSNGGLRESQLDGSLAVAYTMRGDYATAVALQEQALELRVRVLGDDHPDVAVTLHNLALAENAMGDHAAAKPLLERALAIREPALGPEHPDVADTLDALATVEKELGELDSARARMQRVLAVRTAAFGSKSRKVAAALSNLGVIEAAAGDTAAAIAAQERALAIAEETPGPQHPLTAAILGNLASALLERDRAGALELFARAVRIYDLTEGAQPGEAEARFELARASIDSPDEDVRQRARVLAEQALADHRAAGRVAEARTVEDWLAAHP